MSEMIERVARAVDDALPPHWTDGPEENREACLAIARAAFAEIDAAGFVIVPREPTEAMLNGARDWSVKEYGGVDRIGVGKDGASGYWRAMIDAALKD